jgi:GxxExxY protein
VEANTLIAERNNRMLYPEISEKIIKSFYHVYNTLGYGFLEKVYENAMRISLRKQRLNVAQQSPIAVRFEDEIVGEYFADLLIDDKVVIELKSAQALAQEHEAQLINYLRAIKSESFSTLGRKLNSAVRFSPILNPRKSAKFAFIRVPFFQLRTAEAAMRPACIL